MAINNRNIVIFSSIDWSIHWQLHHQLTTSFISAGNRVLFIENTGIRSVNMSDIHRISERISNWRKGIHGFSSIDIDKLTLYSPMLLPFPYSKISLFLNKRIFNIYIFRWIKASNFDNPIVISFLPTPLIQSAIKTIDPELVVYYCANNMAESSESARHVRPYEDYFFKSVDVVFTAARIIQEYAEIFSDKVYYFPPGIDFDKFKFALDSDKIPSDIKSIAKPIVGYIGTLGRVLDQELLCTLAEQCSDFTIVLIGPEYTDIDILKAKPNIVFLGAKSHDQIPYYIKEFNVGIVPYLCNDFTEGVYPSKLNEYLAMGTPAVSTNLREVRESKEIYSEAVVIANSVKEFVEAVKSLAVETNNVLLKEKSIKIAKENSWESRFKGLSKIIEKELIFVKDRQLRVDWKNKFNNYFHIRSKRRKIAFMTIFSFIVIIYSPLFWFLGEQLVVNDDVKKSDAIVVFSGDGESSYQNLSYQRRALDAVEVYNRNYADKIFLSSGREQTIADVEMIMLYVSSKGISKSSIYVLNEYPKSTFQNIVMVKEELDRENVDSILFLTAPYHSLRSMLVWKKNAPNINIVVPDMRDPSLKIIQWGVGFDKIKVIVYEYSAIIHNWILGRI
jgi:glycosyltransferase involved in cell wall biosynthesis/uncharacterized SAM-binding protein YcdF (DUF218 family)